MYCGIQGNTQNEFDNPINGRAINDIHHTYGKKNAGATKNTPMTPISRPINSTIFLSKTLHNLGMKLIVVIYTTDSTPNTRLA